MESPTSYACRGAPQITVSCEWRLRHVLYARTSRSAAKLQPLRMSESADKASSWFTCSIPDCLAPEFMVYPVSPNISLLGGGIDPGQVRAQEKKNGCVNANRL